VRHLLKGWRDVARRIRPQHLLVVLLDYDGTLTPIAATPGQAKLAARTRSVLRALSQQPRTYVGVVSGRPLRDVERCVGVPGLVYAGNHGLEVHGPKLSFTHPSARRSRGFLRSLARRLDRVIESIPGAWTEWKGLTMSIHWRNVPTAAQPQFHRIVHAATEKERRHGEIRLTVGKRVVEIRPPVSWDKGTLVEWLCRRIAAQFRARRLMVCYAGDDRTDEDAFRVVNRLRGCSVFVGGPSRTTDAAYWLKGPREVGIWLSVLSRMRRHSGLRKGEM
jgi:trehalose-phosphatase